MSNFKQMVLFLQVHIGYITKDATHLFEVDVDDDTIWNTYLDSFPEGTNEIFRERRYYDCQCCKNFIRNFGKVVVIDPDTFEKTSIWSNYNEDDKFKPVFDALNTLVTGANIKNVFVNDMKRIGTDSNFDKNPELEWDHFFVDVPEKFITSLRNTTASSVMSKYNSTQGVMTRSFQQIDTDAVETVLDIIAQNNLYRGEEWEKPLKAFSLLQKKFNTLNDDEKSTFCWFHATLPHGEVLGRMKNHSIGTLLLDLSDNMDLETAVKRYENVVAPHNYKRPSTLVTKRMVETAQKTVVDLGYTDSLERRHAALSDMNINDVLFADRDAKSVMSTGVLGVFDDIKSDAKSSCKSQNFDNVQEVSIADFMETHLPTARGLELYLENRHTTNMVSLIAPVNDGCKSMFKWDKPFSWSYNGNIADSSTKALVKDHGGDVEGVLRFSLRWNDDGDCNDDLDAHCVEPNGNIIHYADKLSRATRGSLDVDIIDPAGKTAVENITWPYKTRMSGGEYQFMVHCYSKNGGQSGFTAEIEFDNGVIYTFAYDEPLSHGQYVKVANVIKSGDKFTMIPKLSLNKSNKELWGLNTNKFVRVSTVMLSPNHWVDQEKIGNKHFFFMLENCLNPDDTRGFYNEFLCDSLARDHKRVMEILGNKMKVCYADEQLSGVGFSSTKRNDVVCKYTTETETKVIKIKF